MIVPVLPPGPRVEYCTVLFTLPQFVWFMMLSNSRYKGQIYNGYPQNSYSDRGAGKNDVMSMKNGVFTRGVLFDMPKWKGVPYLGDDDAIYVEDLETWEKKASFRVEPGDAVLVRTGRWVRVREKGPLDLNRATPGLYASCVKWLREQGASILGSDVVQDVRPSRIEGVNQPVHQIALNSLGMPLIDNADLEALSETAAQRRRWTYLLTMNPLRVPGARRRFGQADRDILIPISKRACMRLT